MVVSETSTTEKEFWYNRPKPFDRSSYPYPRFSKEEYERRWNSVREMMDRKELDALLVTGMSMGWDKCWSNVRYLTGYAGSLDNVCYVVMGKDGEPTICTWTSQIDRVARSVVDDIRARRENYVSATGRIKELGAERGRIGLVQPNWHMGIPHEQWEYFRQKLPDAKFVSVFSEFMKDIRWEKSPEEITWIEKAAHLGDLMQDELVKRVKPGVTENEIYGMTYDVILRNGGEFGMILMSTVDTYHSDSPDTRVRPMPRTMKNGYLLNMENGPVYDGYEAQTGKPICIGEPSADYKRMANVALEAYRKVTDQFRVGRTEEDIRQAGKVIYDSGYCQVGAPLCHGMFGGFPQDGPVVSYGDLGLGIKPGGGFNPFSPFEIRKNTIWTVEISVATEDEKKGIFMADTYLVTDGAPRRMQKNSPQLYIV